MGPRLQNFNVLGKRSQAGYRVGYKLVGKQNLKEFRFLS